MRRIIFSCLTGFFTLLILFSAISTLRAQEVRINQKQIDRKRKHEVEQARKAYEADLKKHHKNQSKETRAMMRDSRRKSKHTLSPKK
jgi:hypothetical protein